MSDQLHSPIPLPSKNKYLLKLQAHIQDIKRRNISNPSLSTTVPRHSHLTVSSRSQNKSPTKTKPNLDPPSKPKISLTPSIIDFHELYSGSPKSQLLTLINISKFPARNLVLFISGDFTFSKEKSAFDSLGIIELNPNLPMKFGIKVKEPDSSRMNSNSKGMTRKESRESEYNSRELEGKFRVEWKGECIGEVKVKGKLERPVISFPRLLVTNLCSSPVLKLTARFYKRNLVPVKIKNESNFPISLDLELFHPELEDQEERVILSSAVTILAPNGLSFVNLIIKNFSGAKEVKRVLIAKVRNSSLYYSVPIVIECFN